MKITATQRRASSEAATAGMNAFNTRENINLRLDEVDFLPKLKLGTNIARRGTLMLKMSEGRTNCTIGPAHADGLLRVERSIPLHSDLQSSRSPESAYACDMSHEMPTIVRDVYVRRRWQCCIELLIAKGIVGEQRFELPVTSLVEQCASIVGAGAALLIVEGERQSSDA